MKLRRCWAKVLVIGLMLSGFCRAQALVVPNLNMAQVPVASKSSDDLSAALQQAFAEVLVKYSGNPNVMSLPAVRSALPQVNNWLKRYSYQSTPSQSEDGTSNDLSLQVVFDAKPLEQLLMDAGQALWGADRPAILMLVYQQNGAQSTVMSSDDVTPWVSDMMNEAARRGIVMLWPLYDVSDQNHLSLNQLPNPADQNLNDATRDYLTGRYATPVLVYAVVSTTPSGEYQAQWHLWLQGQWWSWQSKAKQQQLALQEGVDGLADRLAEQMATLTVDQHAQHIEVWVSGIAGLSNYVKVVNYLQSLGPVISVDVADLQNDGVLLDVGTKVAQSSLAQLINQDHHLRAMLAPMTSQVPFADLYYQWPSPAHAQQQEGGDEQQSA